MFIFNNDNLTCTWGKQISIDRVSVNVNVNSILDNFFQLLYLEI